MPVDWAIASCYVSLQRRSLPATRKFLAGLKGIEGLVAAFPTVGRCDVVVVVANPEVETTLETVEKLAARPGIFRLETELGVCTAHHDDTRAFVRGARPGHAHP